MQSQASWLVWGDILLEQVCPTLVTVAFAWLCTLFCLQVSLEGDLQRNQVYYCRIPNPKRLNFE